MFECRINFRQRGDVNTIRRATKELRAGNQGTRIEGERIDCNAFSVFMRNNVGDVPVRLTQKSNAQCRRKIGEAGFESRTLQVTSKGVVPPS